jgi:hypothetical protein
MTKIREVKKVTMEEILVSKEWPSSWNLLLHLLISLFFIMGSSFLYYLLMAEYSHGLIVCRFGT